MSLAPALLLWLHICCGAYGVDPVFAEAVMRVESGTKTQAVRLGRLGKSPYYGPFGIHRDFLKKWPIDDPLVNVLVGVKALRGRDKLKVLRRYNSQAEQAYFRAVFAWERKLKGRHGQY